MPFSTPYFAYFLHISSVIACAITIHSYQRHITHARAIHFMAMHHRHIIAKATFLAADLLKASQNDYYLYEFSILLPRDAFPGHFENKIQQAREHAGIFTKQPLEEYQALLLWSMPCARTTLRFCMLYAAWPASKANRHGYGGAAIVSRAKMLLSRAPHDYDYMTQHFCYSKMSAFRKDYRRFSKNFIHFWLRFNMPPLLTRNTLGLHIGDRAFTCL